VVGGLIGCSVRCWGGSATVDYQIKVIYDAEREKYMPGVVIGIRLRHSGGVIAIIQVLEHKYRYITDRYSPAQVQYGSRDRWRGKRKISWLVIIAGLA